MQINSYLYTFLQWKSFSYKIYFYPAYLNVRHYCSPTPLLSSISFPFDKKKACNERKDEVQGKATPFSFYYRKQNHFERHDLAIKKHRATNFSNCNNETMWYIRYIYKEFLETYDVLRYQSLIGKAAHAET